VPLAVSAGLLVLCGVGVAAGEPLADGSAVLAGLHVAASDEDGVEDAVAADDADSVGDGDRVEAAVLVAVWELECVDSGLLLAVCTWQERRGAAKHAGGKGAMRRRTSSFFVAVLDTCCGLSQATGDICLEGRGLTAAKTPSTLTHGLFTSGTHLCRRRSLRAAWRRSARFAAAGRLRQRRRCCSAGAWAVRRLSRLREARNRCKARAVAACSWLCVVLHEAAVGAGLL